jgi:hypothetical protein
LVDRPAVGTSAGSQQIRFWNRRRDERACRRWRTTLQIILVDPRLKRARTITLTGRSLGLAIGGLVTAIVLAVIGLYAVSLRVSADLRIPLVHDLVEAVTRDELARKDQFMRDNLATMARKLGEMQAQLMRLDALGERVSKMSGIRPEEFNFKELPPRGGVDTGNGRCARRLHGCHRVRTAGCAGPPCAASAEHAGNGGLHRLGLRHAR